MKKNDNQNSGPDNLWQIVGIIMVAFSLALTAYLYRVYKGRIPIFNLDVPGLRIFALSLWGVVDSLFFGGLYYVTHRKIRRIFLLLALIGVAWFFYNFILIDIS